MSSADVDGLTLYIPLIKSLLFLTKFACKALHERSTTIKANANFIFDLPKRATRGRGRERHPLPFFEKKKYPDFGKKGPNCVHPWLYSSIPNVVFRVSRRKSSKKFPCRTFFSYVFDEKFIKVPIPQNLPCSEKFLVACLLPLFVFLRNLFTSLPKWLIFFDTSIIANSRCFGKYQMFKFLKFPKKKSML